MNNIDYISLFMYYISTYLYNSQINITDRTFYLMEFFLLNEAQIKNKKITKRIIKNGFVEEDFYKAYQKLIDIYEVQEKVINYLEYDETVIYLQFDIQKKLLNNFNEEDKIQMNTLAWLYYNFYLEVLRKNCGDDSITIGNYDKNTKMSKYFKN